MEYKATAEKSVHELKDGEISKILAYGSACSGVNLQGTEDGVFAAVCLGVYSIVYPKKHDHIVAVTS